MKRNLLFIILLLFYFSLSSQDFWLGLQVPDSVSDINNIAITPSGELLICTNWGIYSSLNNGVNWEKFGNLDWPIFHVAFSNTAIFADGGYNLFKSTNNGQSWDTLSNYTSFNVSLKVIEDSLIFRTNWGGIYKSTDEGITWTQVLNTYTSQCFYDLDEFDGSLYSSSVAFMNSEDCGIYKSDDWGNNWYLHSLEYYGCVPLLVSNNMLFTGGVGDWPLGSNPGLFVTDNPNTNWVNIYNQGEVYSIAQDSIGGIYLGLQSDVILEWGIRYSNNGGQSWENLNQGLHQSSYVKRLEVCGTGYIYSLLTTINGDTLYRSINPIVKTDEYLTAKQLDLEIFPNPTYSSIEVLVTSERGSLISVKIYNLLGQELQHLQKINSEGLMKISLQCDNYLPGNYIISIVDGNNRVSRIIQKM